MWSLLLKLKMHNFIFCWEWWWWEFELDRKEKYEIHKYTNATLAFVKLGSWVAGVEVVGGRRKHKSPKQWSPRPRPLTQNAQTALHWNGLHTTQCTPYIHNTHTTHCTKHNIKVHSPRMKPTDALKWTIHNKGSPSGPKHLVFKHC